MTSALSPTNKKIEGSMLTRWGELYRMRETTTTKHLKSTLEHYSNLRNVLNHREVI